MQLATQHTEVVQGFNEAVELNQWIDQVTAWRKGIDAEYSVLILEMPRLVKSGQDVAKHQDRMNKLILMRQDLLGYIESMLKVRLEQQLQVIAPLTY